MGEYGDLLISDVAETDPDEEPLVVCYILLTVNNNLEM